MQTITIEINNNNALKLLKNLEDMRLIKILKESDMSSYALAGEPISVEDFKLWLEYAENSKNVSLTQAKKRWADQKVKLQKLII